MLSSSVSTPIYMDICIKGFQIFFSCLFCYFILGYKIEAHKKGGLVIIFIGMTYNCILSGLVESGFNLKLLGLQIILNLGTAFQETWEKYLMHYEYQSPFVILFFEGVLGNFLLVFVFFSYLGSEELSLILPWIGSHLLHLFTFSLVCIGYSVFRIVINRDFSPTHRILADTFVSLVFYVVFLLQITPSVLNIAFLIGFIVDTIGSMVYNEIIILRFFALDKDTKFAIFDREVEERNSSVVSLQELKKERIDQLNQSLSSSFCGEDNY